MWARPQALGLGALILVACLSLFGANPAVRWAERSNAEAALASAGVYVSLRLINGALSVVQEVELGGSAIVSATAQPFKVLDPVDDTIERVAGAVFAVAVASAVLSVALGPVAGLGAGLIGLGALGLVAARRFAAVQGPATAALRLGGVLAVVVPLVLASGSAFGELATRATWAEAQATLQAVSTRAGELMGVTAAQQDQPQEPPPPSREGIAGWFEGLGDSTGAQINDLAQTARDYGGAARYFLSQADALFSAALTLLAIFALNMVVLPGVLLWVALVILRRAIMAV